MIESYHELLASVDEMASATALSAVEGRRVSSVEQSPFSSVDSLSGSHFLRLRTDGPDGRSYILKRISRDWDWVMRVMGDDRCRAVLVWQSGLLDRLPAEITHQVVACCADGGGWAVLLNDVGPAMIPPGDDWISPADNHRLLDGMASLNAALWGQAHLVGAEAGFSSLRQRYSGLSPTHPTHGHRGLGTASIDGRFGRCRAHRLAPR
ncbi:MAG: aminoglycoside phosphotransferase [Chloroflexi bacterium]|nr:aminoglycoside phosphotransferase [Chloroflexota bacterium]